MTRLVAGMFQFGQQNQLFGIRYAQIRSHDFVHNGGWFGGDGALLGLGDLDLHDIARIRDELQAGEAFIVLGESDSHESHWNPQWNDGGSWRNGSHSAAPVDYMIEHARYAIFPGETYMVLHQFVMDYERTSSPSQTHYTATSRCGREDVEPLRVTFQYLSREDLRKKLAV